MWNKSVPSSKFQVPSFAVKRFLVIYIEHFASVVSFAVCLYATDESNKKRASHFCEAPFIAVYLGGIKVF